MKTNVLRRNNLVILLLIIVLVAAASWVVVLPREPSQELANRIAREKGQIYPPPPPPPNDPCFNPGNALLRKLQFLDKVAKGTTLFRLLGEADFETLIKLTGDTAIIAQGYMSMGGHTWWYAEMPQSQFLDAVTARNSPSLQRNVSDNLYDAHEGRGMYSTRTNNYEPYKVQVDSVSREEAISRMGWDGNCP